MQDRKKLFLIDGMALIYRAYYAMINNPLKSSSGMSTSAIFGFINSLIKLIKDENPEYIAVILDSKAKTFRHKMYKQYKANRKPMPDDLVEQIEPLMNLLKSLNIKTYKLDGYEADDIIGTFTNKFNSENIIQFMYSGDKDLMQLVNDNTYLYVPGNSFRPTKIYKKEAVLDKFGVYPSKITDYLALLGDKSDNIPGVNGVGTKTASKLINKYGDLNNIFENIENIDNNRIKNMLVDNKDDAFLSKELATININVKIDFSLKEMDSNKLLFNNMTENLHKLDIFAFDKFLNKDNNKNGNKNNNKNKKYKIKISKKEIVELVNKLRAQEIISIDLETTSIDPIIAEIVGVSFSCKPNSGYYIPFKCPGNVIELSGADILLILKPLLESDRNKFIGQNIKYDSLVLRKYNICLNNIYFDTMIAQSLITSDNNYKLDNMSKFYLNYEMVPIENLIGGKSNQISMKDVPIDKISYYACEDADIALQIYLKQKKILKEEKLDKLFYDVEIPLINVLTDMEHNGVYVDNKIIKQLSENLKIELKKISSNIFKISEETFNINSPQQLANILFDKLKLKMFKKRSTSVEVLKKLLDYHPIAEHILKYRHLNKLVNTYLDKLPNYINSKSNRIHTSFNQTIASTGRLSSTKPNFQNIPIKTEVGKSIRKAFKAQKQDRIIISFDYSQIELRILAHFSEEKKLIEAFNSNVDIHTKTASLIYGINISDVEFEHRRVAKIINYSIVYGAGPFRISEELKIPIKQAASIINNYFERYPGIKDYINNTINFGLEKGYVSTLLGRRRDAVNLRASNKNIQQAEKRASINMPIQGSASELIKIAMININNRLKETKLSGKMILQIHDELLFEVPKYEKDDFIKIVIEEMEGAIKFRVPIKVDCNYGDNWYEAH